MIVTTRTQAGRRFLVLPATLLKVGTFTGSAGAVTYTADVLRASAPLWDGRPVTDTHPTDRDGRPVPAGSRKAVGGPVIGFVRAAKFCEASGRLTAELWIDQDLGSRHAHGLRHAVRSGKAVDVSTRLTVGLDDAGRVVRLDPDHLAVLLRAGPGACSSLHGCGVGV
jgi:hypothetical protein